MLKPVAKAVVALLGSGVVTGVVAALPSPWNVIVGGVLAAATSVLTWLVPNAPEPKV